MLYTDGGTKSKYEKTDCIPTSQNYFDAVRVKFLETLVSNSQLNDWLLHMKRSLNKIYSYVDGNSLKFEFKWKRDEQFDYW